MLDVHQQFWNEWAEAYRGFSESVEAYRQAQRDLARLAIGAMGEDRKRGAISLLDVGGGAGNMISPLLDTLARQRGHLRGVIYTLTDAAKDMLALARARLGQLGKTYPDVEFRMLRVDTLADGFAAQIGGGPADVVVNSWNLEYYPTATRQELVDRLVRLAHPQGVVAFSSTVRLPPGMGFRDILMPIGRAQVFYGFLTGGRTKMDVAVNGLKQIAQFGTAATASHFPEKPTLLELQEFGKRAGLKSVVATYQLFGASAMAVGRRDGAVIPDPGHPEISKVLAGFPGYDGYPSTATFWSSFWGLWRGEQKRL